MKIKVVIVTDYLLLGDGIKKILESVQSIAVVGNTTNITETIRVVKKVMPSVLIVDSVMLDIEGHKLLEYIKDSHMSTRVILLTDEIDDDSLSRVLSMGVNGFLHKYTSSQDMIKAIQKVNDGELWLERKFFSRMINSQNNSQNNLSLSTEKKLSCREEEIITLVAKGHSNKEIAEKLYISEKTVKCHLTSIFRKINVDSRLKIVSKFLQHDVQNSNLA